MQKAHVCRKGLQNADIVTVRRVQEGGVAVVVAAPLGKASQDFFITENTYAECLLGLNLCCVCVSYQERLTR